VQISQLLTVRCAAYVLKILQINQETRYVQHPKVANNQVTSTQQFTTVSIELPCYILYKTVQCVGVFLLQ